MKQTAVEFLIKAFQGAYGDKVINVVSVQVQEAKEMEKEQIKDAYEQGESDGYKQFIINIDKRYESFEQYYKETYNNNDRNSS
jgi:hypothetical protein